MPDDEATTGLGRALDLLVAVRARLRDVIALKVRRGEEVDMDRAEVAALDTDINDLRQRLTELRAAGTVIPALLPAEIQATQRLLDDLAAIAVQDLLVATGINLIKAGVTTARELAGPTGRG
jgi:hypothetical protein